MSTFRQVQKLAEFYDTKGQPEQPITVIGTRAHLRKEFKPAERGGALKAGTHELRIVPRTPKGELQNMDWVGA
jgi:hypothetical protein